MKKNKYTQCCPRRGDAVADDGDMLGLSSGYLERAKDKVLTVKKDILLTSAVRFARGVDTKQRVRGRCSTQERTSTMLANTLR
jgi:hypothetical protein